MMVKVLDIMNGLLTKLEPPWLMTLTESSAGDLNGKPAISALVQGRASCIKGAQFSSVQPLSRVRLFAIQWTEARQASLSITNSQSLLKLMSIESVMPSKQLILWGPLLLLPSIFPCIRVCSNESVLRIRLSKYWSFSSSLSNEYSGLISLRIDWLGLLGVHGTLRSLL